MKILNPVFLASALLLITGSVLNAQDSKPSLTYYFFDG